MIVSIHQPNFFPWMGYFDKMNRSDAFVFLTSSVRSKSDRYLTRTKILNNNVLPQYLSVPLGAKQIPINQLKMPIDETWKKKSLNRIQESYRYTSHFDEVYSDTEKLFMFEAERFSDYSINIINFFIAKFNITTELFIDTDFNQDLGVSNQRNIAICNKLGADVYLSGNGAKAYNDERLYRQNSIKLMYQNYTPITYQQASDKFFDGLSVLDAIFNCGYKYTENLIKQS